MPEIRSKSTRQRMGTPAAKAGGDRDDWESIRFHRAIDEALTAGALSTARELAAEGARRFPDDARLSRAAAVLARPVARQVERRRTGDARADRAWLARHHGEYRGLWVALRSGEVVASAKTLNDLVASLPSPPNGLSITKVP